MDAADQNPLPGANITVQGTFKGAVSGSTGYFSLSGLAAGTHVLQVSFMGFETRGCRFKYPLTRHLP